MSDPPGTASHYSIINMVVERKWGDDHISKSLMQLDFDTWLIGGFLLLHRSPEPSAWATWNDHGDKSSYTLTIAPTPPPSGSTPPDSPFIKLVHEAGDASAVWSIGNDVFCRARFIEEGVTAESTTLKFVQDKKPHSFKLPQVIHHAFGDDRSFLFLQRVPGRTLNVAWPTLNEHWRRHYVNAVVNVCREMAEWKGHASGGVDGKDIPESYLTKKGAPEDFSSANLQKACEAMGTDCSDLVFRAMLTSDPQILSSRTSLNRGRW
jgi:hypothetical protein